MAEIWESCLATGLADGADAAAALALLARFCLPCHATGGDAPMRLETTLQVQRRSAQIEQSLAEARMPPWLPGGGGLEIRGAPGISDSDRALLRRWIAAGLPGLPAEPAPLAPAPPAPSPPAPASGVPAAAPSLPAAEAAAPWVPLARMTQGWSIPAEGEWRSRAFALPTLERAPAMLRALRWRADDGADAVGAITVVADPARQARILEGADGSPGYEGAGDVGLFSSGTAGAMGVGQRTFSLPAGYGIPWPAGADAVVEMHALPGGRPRTVQGALEAQAAEPGATPVTGLLLFSLDVDIPPGTCGAVMRRSVELTQEAELLGALPRAHGICAGMTLRVHRPGESSLTVLELPRWDPHLRRAYLLAAPLRLPAGTTLDVEWRFDNSAANPRVSDPPQQVRLGMGMRDEWPGMLLWLAAPQERFAALEETVRTLHARQMEE